MITLILAERDLDPIPGVHGLQVHDGMCWMEGFLVITLTLIEAPYQQNFY